MTNFRRNALHLAHGIHLTRRFFADAEEACGWLDFEAHEDDIEAMAYAHSDKHGEWQNWRNAWLLGEVSL